MTNKKRTIFHIEKTQRFSQYDYMIFWKRGGVETPLVQVTFENDGTLYGIESQVHYRMDIEQTEIYQSALETALRYARKEQE